MTSTPHRRLDFVMDAGERIIIVLLSLTFVVAVWRAPEVWSRLMIVPEGLTVLLVLFRRSAISVSTYPLDWGLGVFGTMLGLLARPDGAPIAPRAVCIAFIMMGTLISLSAKLSLNTRFAITPANRGVQPAFAYAIIRHPMYAGYMVANVGFFLLNPSLRNAVIYAVGWSIQIGRIYREERWLSQDPAYRSYVEAVRHRLIPGVY